MNLIKSLPGLPPSHGNRIPFRQTHRHTGLQLLIARHALTLSSSLVHQRRAHKLQRTDRMTNITRFPEESVQIIASCLGSDDKFSLRLTCRALESKSLYGFASEHFTKKCVHFTIDSLQVLAQVSKSPLREYVREVSVIPRCSRIYRLPTLKAVERIKSRFDFPKSIAKSSATRFSAIPLGHRCAYQDVGLFNVT